MVAGQLSRRWAQWGKQSGLHSHEAPALPTPVRGCGCPELGLETFRGHSSICRVILADEQESFL